MPGSLLGRKDDNRRVIEMAYEMMARHGIMETGPNDTYRPTRGFMERWKKRATDERNLHISLCRAFLDRCPAGMSDVTLSVMTAAFLQHIGRSPEGMAAYEGMMNDPAVPGGDDGRSPAERQRDWREHMKEDMRK